MVEYSSVSASSYDPASLVAKLNASAEEGWDVVSIVPTGGDVTAFLRRDEAASDADGAGGDADVIELAPDDTAGAEQAAGLAMAGVAADATPAAGIESPLEEPAGWAHEPAAEPPADVIPPTEPDIPEVSDVAAPEPDVTTEPDIAAEPEPVPEPAPEPPAAAEAEAPVPEAPAPEAPAPAVAPVVTTPAGWYPDPSTRFELRYWDGSQWTEHVARGGQQHTDPPVA